MRDVIIVGPKNPAVQLDTTQPREGGAAEQMDATTGESGKHVRPRLNDTIWKCRKITALNMGFNDSGMHLSASFIIFKSLYECKHTLNLFLLEFFFCS